MTAGGKKSKRRRQQALINITGLRAEQAAPSPAGVEKKPEEPPAPLDRILALDDLQLMKTYSDARYLRTFGFLFYLLAMCSFGLMAMKIYREPPPEHPLHGPLAFGVIIVNLIFFLAFGILFRHLRCRAARILMRVFTIICMAVLALGAVFSSWADLTALVMIAGFLLVFFFIFRALRNPLLFGPVAVTYRQLVLIRRKRMQEEKITWTELPPCRTAGKFDYAVIAAAWIGLVLMFVSTFSGAFIKVPAPKTDDPKPAQSVQVQTAPAPQAEPAPVTPAGQKQNR